MKKVINRGFTLIELLVVIAIIGILASIILVSLNSARQKGKDTRVLSDVNQVRTQIESEATAGGTYQVGASFCVISLQAANASTLNSTTNNCATLVADANANSGGTLTVKTNGPSAGTTFTAYAIRSPLGAGGYYCVDSTGQAGSQTGTIPTTSACP